MKKRLLVYCLTVSSILAVSQFSFGSELVIDPAAPIITKNLKCGVRGFPMFITSSKELQADSSDANIMQIKSAYEDGVETTRRIHFRGTYQDSSTVLTVRKVDADQLLNPNSKEHIFIFASARFENSNYTVICEEMKQK